MKIHQYTTLKNLSDEKSVNYHTLRSWVLRSRVKTKKMGNMILIRKKDVNKIMQQVRS